MEDTKSLFDFNGDAFLSRPESHVARIPARIIRPEELFDALQKELQLPDYFGANWNALDECLGDLSWIQPRGVVILHADLPALPRNELNIYLEVLADSVESWKPGEEHTLNVVFPREVRDVIVEWEKEHRKGKGKSGS
jgi:hypothetical protein